MKTYRFVAVALALAVSPVLAVALMAFGASDAAAASLHAPDILHEISRGFSSEHLMASWPALLALRSDLDALLKKAKDKIGEIKDDTAPDAARSIEAEHKTLLDQIEAKRAEIAAEEKLGDPATRGQQQPSNENSRAEANRAADILDIGTRAGMEASVIQEAIRNGTSLDAFRIRAFDAIVERQNGHRTDPARSRIVRDEQETRRTGMQVAMAFRMGGIETLTADQQGQARSFMENHDMVDFAAEAIGHRGRIRSAFDRYEVIERAFHSTSDFPAIFSSAMNTTLERQYALAQPTYRRIAARMDFMDFRPHYTVKAGEFPMLEKMTENGDITFGTFGESKEQIQVVPYAKGIRVSRQMLVNDRLNAIGRTIGGYGRTVARFEDMTFFSMMLAATTVLSDGQVVFHSTHANVAGSGAAISVASIGAGKAAMRKQKGLDDAILDIQPSILLVSPDKETEALQYLSPILAADSVKVNPYVGTLDPVVSVYLSGNAWYLFADPADAPVYHWGLLEGATAPRVRIDEPFGSQGMGVTVEHDFGCGATDFRGGYKNPGA